MRAKVNAPDLTVLANVMNSQCHMEGLRTTVMSELKKHGFYAYSEVEVRPSYDYESLVARVRVQGEEHYEALMNCEHTGVNVDEISATWIKDIICLPQDIKVRLSITVCCKTPDSDLITLRQLGKIKTHASPAHVYESVSCW